MSKRLQIQQLVCNEYKSEFTDRIIEEAMKAQIIKTIQDMEFKDIADIEIDPYSTKYTIRIKFIKEEDYK